MNKYIKYISSDIKLYKSLNTNNVDEELKSFPALTDLLPAGLLLCLTLKESSSHSSNLWVNSLTSWRKRKRQNCFDDDDVVVSTV